MVGMGLGAILGRELLARGFRPRTGYIASELIIGVGGAGTALFLLSSPLPSVHLGGGLVTDVLASFTVALPPSLAIGATYPFLVAACGDERRGTTWLYVGGLAGGLVGVVGAGFVVVPRFGADTAALGAAGINLLVAGLAIRALAPFAQPPVEAKTEDGRAHPRRLVMPTVLFSAAGVFGLGAQVVWSRAIAPYAGVSVFTFSAIIALYLLAEAIGLTWSRKASAETAVKAGKIAAVTLPALSVLTLGVGPAIWQDVPPRNDGFAWLSQSVAVVAVSVGPAATLLGLVQGWSLRLLEEERDEGHARAAGFVVGVATAASALAGVIATLVLTPLLGARWTLLVLGAPLLLIPLVDGKTRMPRTAGALVLAAIAIFASPGPDYFLGGQFDDAEKLLVDLNPQETTAVVVHDRPTEPRIRHLVSNGVSYSGDSLFAQRYMRALGHFPALAATRRERALVICIGTGSTAGALLTHRFEQIDAVDISPAIRRTLARFAHVHGGLPDAGNVTIHIADGQRFLATHGGEKWDVITLEPPPPRAPGASALYSAEFYRLAAQHLTEGGAIAQWLPLHGLSAVELQSIAHTFVEAFPDATLHMVERNEAILLGGGTPRHECCSLQPTSAAWQDLGAIGFAQENPLEATLVADARLLESLVDDAPIIHDSWPMPELTPLHGLATTTADEWLDELAESSTSLDSQGGQLLHIAPAFVRILEGRGRQHDRRVVQDGMFRWLASAPSNAYRQHAFGYGPLLESRLDRLTADGELSEQERAAYLRQLEGNRQRTEAGIQSLVAP